MRRQLSGEGGSAPAEFALVSGILVLAVLMVIQLALALYVRTTVIDAAAEGARQQALADADPGAGELRTDQLIDAALGSAYRRAVDVGTVDWHGRRVMVVTVRATFPVVGLLGPDRALQVAGHAALEGS